MPIQILWGNDLNAQNTFIQKLIDKEVSKEWKEINVTNLNGDDDELSIFSNIVEFLFSSPRAQLKYLIELIFFVFFFKFS